MIEDNYTYRDTVNYPGCVVHVRGQYYCAGCGAGEGYTHGVNCPYGRKSRLVTLSRVVLKRDKKDKPAYVTEVMRVRQLEVMLMGLLGAGWRFCPKKVWRRHKGVDRKGRKG